MKKLLTSVLALTMTIAAFAGKPTGLRLGGGLAATMYRSGQDIYTVPQSGDLFEGANFHLDNATYYGGFIEVGYDWAFSQHSALCAGVKFSALFKNRFNVDKKEKIYDARGTDSYRSYIDIPVMYQYSWNAGPKVQMFFQAGPTVNFWLSNISRAEDTYVPEGKKYSVTYSERYDWFSKNKNVYSRVNLSLGVNLGVYFHHVKIYAGWNQGMLDFIRKAPKYYTAWNGQLQVGACYVW